MTAFLLDIDGTTLLGEAALPGALEFVAALREREVEHLWLTNNTSLSRAGWLERLRRAGFEPGDGDLYTAGDATIDFLKSLGSTPRVHLVGTEALRRSFEEAGLTLSDGDAEVVVLGYDTELTYEKIRRAALLLRDGVPYYATHPDVTCPTPEGPVPDVGAFAALFEAACGRTPTVIGKPEPTMAAGALARLGVAAGETIMVGDRLETDIRMANRAGLDSFLVLTGVTSAKDVAGAADQPSRTFSSLRAVLDWLPT